MPYRAERAVDDIELERMSRSQFPRWMGFGGEPTETRELESAKAGPWAALHTPAQDTAERRRFTVMFSDLVGSTAFSARMDPEGLREVVANTRSALPRQ